MKKIVNKYTNYNENLASYDNHFDTALLQRIIEDTKIKSDLLSDKEALEKEVSTLSEYFKAHEATSLRKYDFEIVEDEEHNSNMLKITVKTKSRTKRFKLNSYFLNSAEFADLVKWL